MDAGRSGLRKAVELLPGSLHSERGRRVVEVLKQPQFSPIPVEEQVIVIYAVTEGHMDKVALGDVRRFEDEMRAFFRRRHPGLLAEIRESGKLPEADTVDAAMSEFIASIGVDGVFEVADEVTGPAG